jgi:hypothetical protein
MISRNTKIKKKQLKDIAKRGRCAVAVIFIYRFAAIIMIIPILQKQHSL